MSVKLIAVKCPECGATLNIEEDRTQAFCTYCGTKVLVHNENEHIYRNIDEARIARAKTERIVKEKQMEFAERRWIAQETRRKNKVKLALILGIAGGVLMVIGFMAGEATGNGDSSLYTIAIVGLFALEAAAFIAMSNRDEEDNNSIYSDTAKLPELAWNYERKDYKAVEAVLRSAGFTNIRCVPLNDLAFGVIYKPGMVESVTINGNDNISPNRKYSKDASIVISYHSRG